MRYRVIALLAIVTGLVAYRWRGESWLVDAYMANLSATFIGTIVLLFFIDRAVEHAREKERLRIERIALEQARLPLIYLLGLFSDMLKASAPTRIDKPPGTLDEFLSAPNTVHLDYLNMAGQPGTIGKTTWYEHVEEQSKKICDKLSAVVDKYLAYFGIAFVANIEALCGAQYLFVLRNLGTARAQLEAEGIKREYTLERLGPLREDFFRLLLDVLRYYNRVAAVPITVPNTLSRDDVMPKTGSSRFTELPPDSSVHLGEPSSSAPVST